MLELVNAGARRLMHVEFNTRKKLQALLAQISQLLLSDFPHSSSRTALEALQKFFLEEDDRLDRASRSPHRKLVEDTCISVNERIYHYLPILGFLLRSTNVRNNFEAYYSLVEIAEALIGPNAKVVVSSEWDFSPLTYPMTVSVLPDYVLLGMPSSESSNALILPLAGHELGHSVWRNEDLENRYVFEVQDGAKEYFKNNWPAFLSTFPEHEHLQPTDDEFATSLLHVISQIVSLALSQLEETFCDGLGVHLFGASYVFAFHYLLAPSLGGTRSLEYPQLAVRGGHLATLGGLDLNALGFSDFSAEFREKQPNLVPRQEFISLAADEIAQQMSNSMYQRARQVVISKASRFAPDENAQADILRMFDHAIPARAPRSLADILNAGWHYVRTNANTFDEDKRNLFEWVSELILKSIEVLEYRTRVTNA